MNKTERLSSVEKPVQQANRVFTVSLAPPNEIYEGFKDQSPQETISILRFYLGLKGEENNYRYTLLGGKIACLENPSEALVREVVEEVGISTLGLPYHTQIGRWHYTIPGKGEKREIILTYQPILPQQEISIGDPKIQQIVTLTWHQLKTLIEQGKLNDIPIEGHLALSPKEEIDISLEDFERQKTALTKGLSWMQHIEVWLQKKIQAIFSQNPQISYEEFEKVYQRILSRFMRRGIETALSYKKIEEVASQEENPLIRALNEGYLGRDILYFLPQLAKYGLDWYGLEETTEGTKTFVNFLKSVFESFEEKPRFLQIIADPETILAEKHHLLINLNDHFKRILASIFGLKEEELTDALEMAQNFYRELLTDIRENDDGFRRVYQDYALINEINNAHYGQLLMLFLGYDIKPNNPEEMKKIRFEAGRQLLIVLKTLSIYQLYKQSCQKAKEGKTQILIKNLGSLEAGEDSIELEPGKTIRVRRRRLLIPNFENFEAIIDEKPNKPFASFLRKSFYEPLDKLKDITNLNIVLVLDYQSLSTKNFLDFIDKFRQKLLDFIKQQFPDIDLNISDIKYYGLNDFVQKKDLNYLKGYRAGSQSNRFLREKFILSLGEESLEIIIYPFVTTNGDDQWWGWLETIKDNDDYRQRRLFSSENAFPSLYDLLFPPEIYPAHYQQKTCARYHQ